EEMSFISELLQDYTRMITYHPLIDENEKLFNFNKLLDHKNGSRFTNFYNESINEELDNLQNKINEIGNTFSNLKDIIKNLTKVEQKNKNVNDGIKLYVDDGFQIEISKTKSKSLLA